MSVDPGQPSRLAAAYLDDVQAELEAFDALVAIGSRFAAYHLEQAAEKLIRAVRISPRPGRHQQPRHRLAHRWSS